MSKSTERAEKAAAALQELRRAEQRRNRITVIAVVAVIALIVGGGFLVNQLRSDDQAVNAPEAGAGASTPAGSGASGVAGTEYGVAIGDPDAPHSIVVYEDFVCPFCGQFEAASRDRLAALAEEGKVYVEYRPIQFLSTDYSVDAANAFKVTLETSGAETAKKLHDLLYEQQPSEAGPFPDDDWYVDRAVEAGASEDDVRPGIEGAAEADWVQTATQAAVTAKVDATPTILLDGEDFARGATIDDIVGNLVAEVA